MVGGRNDQALADALQTKAQTMGQVNEALQGKQQHQ